MIHQSIPSRLVNGPIRGSSRRAFRELIPFIVFLVALVAVGCGFIYVRSGIRGIRKEISALSEQKGVLVEQNRVLLREMATLSSPSRIIPLAQAQGLVFPEAGSFRSLALAELPPEAGDAGDGAAPSDTGGGSPLAAFIKGIIP